MRVTHLHLVNGVSECGYIYQAITTKDNDKVTCKLCKKIIKKGDK